MFFQLYHGIMQPIFLLKRKKEKKKERILNLDGIHRFHDFGHNTISTTGSKQLAALQQHIDHQTFIGLNDTMLN